MAFLFADNEVTFVSSYYNIQGNEDYYFTSTKRPW